MKKFIKYILTLSLVLITMFSFAGCGNNDSDGTQPETPASLVFTEEFGFDELQTYKNGIECINIDSLSQFAYYKYVTLYAKKQTSFNHLSFKIKSNSEISENLYVSISTPSANWISSPIEISSNEAVVEIYYVRWNSGSHEFLTQKENNGNNSFVLDKVSFAQDEELTISFGTRSEALNWKDYYATGEYSNSISIYGFEIE